MEITTMSEAMQLHAQLLKSYHHQHNYTKLFTFSALSPSGNLLYARLILNSLHHPTSYHYNTFLRASSISSYPTQTFSIFFTMHDPPDPTIPRPDKFTYPFVLKACAKLQQRNLGKQLHCLIYKSGLVFDPYILNGLIHMYSGCGEMSFASKVFDKMSHRDVVSWTSMIDGFVENNKPIEAIYLFEQMMEGDVEPNDATMVSVLRACADTGALSVGIRVNKIVEEKRINTKGNVSTALIDMYAKCGCIDSATRVFNETVNKDVFAWTAMIAGLASHGECNNALNMFEQMMSFGIKPDERAMTAVLSACRNVSWVSEGLAYFKNMRKKYKVRPTIQHYGCIVDLLVRTGRLKEAEEVIRKMPIKPDFVLWRTLIWGCKIHGDIDRAERLMKYLEMENMNSNDSGNYVLIGNVYASAGKWQEKAKSRELMNQRGLAKPPGYSRIEIDGVVQEFSAGDSGHIEAENIYAKLNEMEERLRSVGYSPILSEVLLEIDDEEKAFQLLHHSEKLAVAFGLITTGPGTVVRIVKNLRSCEDCHSFMKFVSKIYQREIIARDRIRFHHFRNGECSCKDNW